MTQETAFQSAWKIVETEAHVIFAKVVVLPQVWALTGGLRKYTGCILNTKKKKTCMAMHKRRRCGLSSA